jgi:uncharacterized protein (TIGR00251 family)
VPVVSNPASRINVIVKPRSSGDSIEGWKEGTLVVRLGAPPVQGAANKALIKLLADRMRVAKGKVRIVSGEKGRNKVVEVEGVAPEELRERIR